jgi:hypothetical protein
MARSWVSYGETVDIPHADLIADKDLAERLVAAQFPELAAHLIEHEQQWLPVLQRRVELPLPVPVAIDQVLIDS